MFEVFFRFLVLGCLSFGGPIAHIGYFQREFVEKRKWIEEDRFTIALSLCQFLPGPASSQLGMFIGYQKAGFFGAIAAFIGFTLPSFLLLTLAAIYSAKIEYAGALIYLLGAAKLLAVIVVAEAIWVMGRKFIHNTATFCICATSTIWILWQTGLTAQLLPIVISGILGWFFIKNPPQVKNWPNSKGLKQSFAVFCSFLLLLIIPLFINTPLVNLFQHFYQAGSFVFGGGHVVLPLLQPLIGNEITNDVLVEGYAAAQLIPGPMFTIASYIGASIEQINPIIGSLVATIAIFLPGALLLFAALPIWQSVMHHPKFSGSIVLINASVVGLLIAAFYQPIWISAIHDGADIITMIIGFILVRKYSFSVFSLLAALLVYEIIKIQF